MIVSDSHRFVALQPWKCASTTPHRRLQAVDSGRYPQGDFYSTDLRKQLHTHLTLDDFLRLPEANQDLYRFCFIRNPYDRIYSGFLQRRHRLTTDHAFATSTTERAAELESIRAGFVSYLRFSAARANPPPPLHLHTHHHGRPQLDFIGYVETFEHDFSRVCDRLGIDHPGTGNANVRTAAELDPVEDLAVATHRYLHQFCAESIALTNALFARDFELLPYAMLWTSDIDPSQPTDLLRTNASRSTTTITRRRQ